MKAISEKNGIGGEGGVAWVFFGTTLVCGIGWLRAELAGRAACLLLEWHGIETTELDLRCASRAAIKQLFSRRK